MYLKMAIVNMKIYLMLLLSVVVIISGCKSSIEPQTETASEIAHRLQYEQYVTAEYMGITNDNDRFDIHRIKLVKDTIAYNGIRGIYEIHDKLTNKIYLGVSGVGITELTSCGKGGICEQ